MKVLVTGAAGFIGMHLCCKLLNQGFQVVGIDNINDYYDIKLKKDRIANIFSSNKNFVFERIDILDIENLKLLYAKENFTTVIHLAAQAGVRYSKTNPDIYIKNNIQGFFNIIDLSSKHKISHFIFASSSSVYGLNQQFPSIEESNTDHPVSIYGATKKSNEMLAHAYSNIYNMPITGLRFFTVYGPWGRPDMAYFSFTNSILNNKPITIYNNGKMKRDFTFIDDVIDGIYKIFNKVPKYNETCDNKNLQSSSISIPFKIFNIGNRKPEELMKYINVLENVLGKKAKKIYAPMQKEDVLDTSADINKIINWVEFSPKTDIEDGISKFVKWYFKYYKIY